VVELEGQQNTRSCEMSPHSSIEQKPGYYFGTVIDNKWWKRYKEDGFFARGNGHYSYDDKTFYFYKYPSDKPITIPLKDIDGFEIGKWHAGRWGAGMPVLKIIWKKGGLLLSSGFILSKNRDETEKLISELQYLLE